MWNSSPGALLTLPTYSDAMQDFPFLLDQTGHQPKHNYTAVIYVQVGNALTPTSALYRLVKAVTKSQFVDRVSSGQLASRLYQWTNSPCLHQIVILWASDRPAPPRKRWPAMGHIPLHVVLSNHAAAGTHEAADDEDIGSERPSISQRFYPHSFIETDAILSLDEDATLNTDELDFAYLVWRDFPDRVVGYPARAHYWDDGKVSGGGGKWEEQCNITFSLCFRMPGDTRPSGPITTRLC